MKTDLELLICYSRDGSEEAFNELVRRHVDWVYTHALRRVGGDTLLARDVAQSVFIDLANKAARLADPDSRKGLAREQSGSGFCLEGWLYTSTRFAASKMVRAEQTRRRYEQDAHLSCPQPQWQNSSQSHVRPVLDEAMDHLNEVDRNAVILRFLEGHDLKSVGRALGLSEDAARKRVGRALHRLRIRLAQRGWTGPAEVLSGALVAESAHAAPVGLVQVLMNPLASAGPLGAAKLASTTALMISTKAKLGMVAVVLAVLTTPLLLRTHQVSQLREQNQMLLAQLSAQSTIGENALTAPNAAGAPPVTRPLPVAASAEPFRWNDFQSPDYRQYQANLRSLGVPEQTITDILLGQINRTYEQKRRAILGKSDIKDEFWRVGGQSMTSNEDVVRDVQALGKEKESLLRDLLGLETDQREFMKAYNFRSVEDEVEWKWAFLSPEKREQIKSLMTAFWREIPETPNAAAAKTPGLEQEFEAKVAEILTPAELEDHELRHSNLAFRLRSELDQFQPTEAEFRAIYRVLSDSGRNTPGSTIPPDKWEQDKDVFSDPGVRERLSAALGPDRLGELDQKRQTLPPGEAQVTVAGSGEAPQ